MMTSSCSSSVITETTHNRCKKKYDETPWVKGSTSSMVKPIVEESPLFVPRSLLTELMGERKPSKRPCEATPRPPLTATKLHKSKRGRDSEGSIQFQKSPTNDNFHSAPTVTTATPPTVRSEDTITDSTAVSTHSSTINRETPRIEIANIETDNRHYNVETSSSPLIFSASDTESSSTRQWFPTRSDLKQNVIADKDDMILSPIHNYDTTTLTMPKDQSSNIRSPFSKDSTFQDKDGNSQFWQNIDIFLSQFETKDRSDPEINGGEATMMKQIACEDIPLNKEIFSYSEQKKQFFQDESLIMNQKQLLETELQRTKKALQSVRAERDDIENVLIQIQKNQENQMQNLIQSNNKKCKDIELKMKQEVVALNEQIQQKDNNAMLVELELELKEKDLLAKENEIKNRECECHKLEQQLITYKNQTDCLLKKVTETDIEVDLLQMMVQDQDSKIETLNKQLQIKQEELNKVHSELEQKYKDELFDSHHLKAQIQKLKKELGNAENKIFLLEDTLKDRETHLEQKESTIQELRKSLSKEKRNKQSTREVTKPLENDLSSIQPTLEKNACKLIKSSIFQKTDERINNLFKSGADIIPVEIKQPSKKEINLLASLLKSNNLELVTLLLNNEINSFRQDNKDLEDEQKSISAQKKEVEQKSDLLDGQKNAIVHQNNYDNRISQIRNNISKHKDIHEIKESDQFLAQIQKIKGTVKESESFGNCISQNDRNTFEQEKCDGKTIHVSQGLLENYTIQLNRENGLLKSQIQTYKKDLKKQEEEANDVVSELASKLYQVNGVNEEYENVIEKYKTRIENLTIAVNEQNSIILKKEHDFIETKSSSILNKELLHVTQEAYHELEQKNKSLMHLNDKLEKTVSSLESQLETNHQEIKLNFKNLQENEQSVRKMVAKQNTKKFGISCKNKKKTIIDKDEMMTEMLPSEQHGIFVNDKNANSTSKCYLQSIAKEALIGNIEDEDKNENENENKIITIQSIPSLKEPVVLEQSQGLIDTETDDGSKTIENQNQAMFKEQQQQTQRIQNNLISLQKRFDKQKDHQYNKTTCRAFNNILRAFFQSFLHLLEIIQYDSNILKRRVEPKLLQVIKSTLLVKPYHKMDDSKEKLQLLQLKKSNDEVMLEDLEIQINELISCILTEDQSVSTSELNLQQNQEYSVVRKNFFQKKLRLFVTSLEKSKLEVIELEKKLQIIELEFMKLHNKNVKVDTKEVQTIDILPISASHDIQEVIQELVEELERTKSEFFEQESKLNSMSEKCNFLELEIVALESSLKDFTEVQKEGYSTYRIKDVEGMKIIIEELVIKVEMLDSQCKILQLEKDAMGEPVKQLEVFPIEQQLDHVFHPKFLSFHSNEEDSEKSLNTTSSHVNENVDDIYLLSAECLKIELDMVNSTMHQMRLELAESIELNERFEAQIANATEEIRLIVLRLNEIQNKKCNGEDEPDLFDEIYDLTLEGYIRHLNMLLKSGNGNEPLSLDSTELSLDIQSPPNILSKSEELNCWHVEDGFSSFDNSSKCCTNNTADDLGSENQPYLESLHHMVNDSRIVLKDALVSFHTHDELTERTSHFFSVDDGFNTSHNKDSMLEEERELLLKETLDLLDSSRIAKATELENAYAHCLELENELIEAKEEIFIQRTENKRQKFLFQYILKQLSSQYRKMNAFRLLQLNSQ